MTDDTQAPLPTSADPVAAAESVPAQTDTAGTTTLDLTATDVGTTPVDTGVPTETATIAATGTTVAATGTTVNTAVFSDVAKLGAQGVVSRLESDLIKEFQKGERHFMTWITSAINELKQHLKV